MATSYAQLNNGSKMPFIGLGTGGFSPEVQYDALKSALQVGYRLIDTAYMYKNEDVVGRAVKDWIKDGGKREDVFITSKLPQIALRASDVERFLKMSLKSLQTDYVDLYLIHWPFGFENVDDVTVQPMKEDGTVKLDMATDLESVWKAMEAQVIAGRAKSIGVSNFNPEQVERIVKVAKILPVTNQVECHVYLQQKELREVCKKHEIIITAYSPLGSPGAKELVRKINGIDVPWDLPNLLENSTVQAIAKAHGKTPSQVLLRFDVDRNIVAIPRSGNSLRIKENFEIFDFNLSPEDVQQLEGLDERLRLMQVTDIMFGCEKHPEFPFK